MVSLSFPTLAQARGQLRSRGMVLHYHDRMQGREYWIFADGRPNVFVDHSATITRVSGRYHVSDFATAK